MLPPPMSALEHRVRTRAAVLGVIGLGVTGLTAAVAFAAAGFRVVGVDRDARAVSRASRASTDDGAGSDLDLERLRAQVVASGHLVATTRYEPLREADVVLVAVETPVDETKVATYEALVAACTSLGRVMRQGTLVVVESTVGPGTMDRIVRPALEKATGSADFLLGHCPERVMPGKLLGNLRTLARVCGADREETARTMSTLYGTVVSGRLTCTDLATAEVVKTAENAYRDVSIAFANELALVCERAGVDFMAVRALVNECPHRDVHLAGAGVGGPCLPKDPWLFVSGLGEGEARLVPAARAVNDAMPAHVAKLLEDALFVHGIPLAGARIVLLGWAYLEGSADSRGSSSRALCDRLRELGAEVSVHDPHVEEHAGDPWTRMEGAHAVVVATAHDAYRTLDLERLRRTLARPVLVDGRHVVDPAAARAAGLTFRGVGRSHGGGSR